MKQLLGDQLENRTAKNQMQSYAWQWMPQVHLWGICPQNKNFYRKLYCRPSFSKHTWIQWPGKNKITLTSKWAIDCVINDTNNKDENKQLLTERLCIQTIIINKKSFLHPYWEHKNKIRVKRKQMLPPREQEGNPQVQGLRSALSPAGFRPWLSGQTSPFCSCSCFCATQDKQSG